MLFVWIAFGDNLGAMMGARTLNNPDPLGNLLSATERCQRAHWCLCFPRS